ncbi:hypothetical protein D3C80_1612350 [compost metagenome]
MVKRTEATPSSLESSVRIDSICSSANAPLLSTNIDVGANSPLLYLDSTISYPSRDGKSFGNDLTWSNSKLRLNTLSAVTTIIMATTPPESPGLFTTNLATGPQNRCFTSLVSPYLGTLGQKDLRPNKVNKAGNSVTDANIMMNMVIPNIGAKF